MRLAAPALQILIEEAPEGRENAKKVTRRAALEVEQKAGCEAAIVYHAAENCGTMPMNQSTERAGIKRVQLAEITATDGGAEVVLRVRLQNTRAQGAKMCFLVLRQQRYSIEGVLAVASDGSVSEQMEKWASRVNPESVALVHGVIAKPPNRSSQPVR